MMLRSTIIWFTKTKFGTILHKSVSRYRSHNLGSALPKYLHIETSSVCNSKCVMCAYPNTKRPKQFMSDDLFNKIAADSRESQIKWVNLQFYGEPLLDKKILERIRFLKSYKIKVKFNSNASVLSSDLPRSYLIQE